ncbi:MAG: translocation/assembly module TamB domain-containing protein [Chitinispirillaceae bacterium]|nr:translocation/assembly module TamB domain-containing protein [Chitinispirillaceae bacterium]
MTVQTVRRIAGISIAVAAIGFVIVAVTGFFLLLIPPVQHFTLKRILQQVQPLVTGRVSVGYITTNLYSTLELHDISVGDTMDSSGMLHVNYLRIKYLLPMLLRKEIRITSLTCSGITARCSISEKGEFIFPALPVPQDVISSQPSDKKETAQQWRLKTGPISLKGIQAEFQDHANLQTATINSGQVQARLVAFDSGNVQLTFSDGSYKSPWWTGENLNIAASVRFSSSGLQVSGLSIKSDLTSLVGSGSIPFVQNGKWGVKVSASSDVAVLPVLHATVPGIRKSGPLAVCASWFGTFDYSELMLDINSYNIEINGIKADTLHITASYDTASSITGTVYATTSIGNAETTISGKIFDLFSSPEIGAYRMDAQLNGIHPDKIIGLDTLIPSNFKGLSFTSEVQVNGAGTVTLPKTIICNGILSIPELSTMPGMLYATLEDSMVSLSFTLDDNTFLGNCILMNNNYSDSEILLDGEFDISLLNMSGITTKLLGNPVSGVVKSHAVIGGTLHYPELTAKINGQDISWQSVSADSVMAVLSMSQSKNFSIDTLWLVGSAVLDSLGPAHYKNNVKGVTSFDVTAHGPLLRPDFTAALSGTDLSYGKTVIDTCTILATVTSLDTISLKYLNIHFSDFRASLSGSGEYLMGNRSGAVDIQCIQQIDSTSRKVGRILANTVWQTDSITAIISVSEIPLALIGSILALEKPVSGILSTSCSLSGAIRNPLIDMQMNIFNPGYDQYHLKAYTANIRLADSLLTGISVINLTSTDSMVLQAHLPLRPSVSYLPDTSGDKLLSISVSGQNIQAEHFRDFLDSTWNIAGTVNLNATVQTDSHRLEIGGGVNLRNGRIGNELQHFVFSGIDVDADFSGPIFQPEAMFELSTSPIVVAGEKIDRFHGIGSVSLHHLCLDSGDLFLGDNGHINLSGLFPFDTVETGQGDSAGFLNFSIVQLPLKLAAPFVSGITLQEGSIQGNGSIILRKGSPEIHGGLSLSGGTATLEDIEPKIGPVNLSVDLSGDTIIVRKIDAVWGKGACSAEGTVVLRSDSLPEVAGRCRAKGLYFTMPEVVDGVIDRADLLFSTEKDGYQISGTVKTGACRYTQDIQIDDLLTSFRKPSYTAREPGADSIRKLLQMNIGIDLQDNIILDMNLGYLKIGGSFQLTGDLASPSYTGEIRLSEGYVYYLDRRFTIERAVLANFNPRVLNPGIDIEGSAQITAVSGGQMENYTIVLTVSGNMDDPVVTLREKSGALNELEIVSILTFGQLTGGMNGDVRQRLQSFVSQSVLGFGTRKLEHALGIEKIEFQGDVFGGKDAAASSRVTIAKRVSPRLTVLYETEIGALEKPKISALFRIVKNVFLSGERTSDGKSGIDLIFKYSK